jgi:hypothetical protein
MPSKLRTIESLKNFAPKFLELETRSQVKNKPTCTITRSMTNTVWNSMKDSMTSLPTNVISTERNQSMPPEPQNKIA